MYFFSKGIVFVCKLPTWKLTFYMEKFIFQVLRWFIMIKNSIFLPNAINQNQFAWYNPWQIIIIWCRCVCKLLNFCPIVFNWISVQSDFYHVCIAILGIKKCLNYKIEKKYIPMFEWIFTKYQSKYITHFCTTIISEHDHQFEKIICA